MTGTPSVLVAGRHGAYSLELRRSGITVSEPADLDGDRPTLAACVLDAVGDHPPVAADWDRVLAVLRADLELPVLAVVNGEPPGWLAEVAARADLVQAPVSGRTLADRVRARVDRALPTDEVAPSPSTPAGPEDDEPTIDLGLSPRHVVDLVSAPSADTASTARWRRPGGGAVRPSAPLHMASTEELAERIVAGLRHSRPLREVGAGLAVTLADELHADVGVLAAVVEGPGWLVIAGVGLRDVEWRPLADDPVVLELLDGRRPILRVEASDDVRGSVASLPCARHEHLLVARHPALPLLVLAGRDGSPFARGDVRTLGQVLVEDGALAQPLAEAFTLRALAHALAGHLDG